MRAPPQRRAWLLFCTWSAVAVVAGAGLYWSSPWNEHLPLFFAAAAGLFLACWGVAHTRIGFLPVLLGAIALRALLLPLPPVLSGDVYRYVWEGRVQASGVNPYVHAPADSALTAFRDADWSRINHPELTAIYPPLAQLAFRGLAAAGGVTTFKIAFVLFDFGVIAFLAGALRQRGAPPARLALYAWNPLPVIEIAGNGHMEPLALVFLLGAVVCVPTRPARAWLALACCIAVKFAGAVVAPLLARARPPRAWVLGIAVLGLAAVALPYADAGMGLVASLRLYAAKWRFNDLLFAPLLALFGSLARAKTAAAILALLVIGVLIWRRVALERAVPSLLGAVLLLSPTIHPWYLLWPAVFLPLAPILPLFLWSGSVLFAYLLVFPFGNSPVFPPQHWLPRGLELAPPVLGLVWEWRRARRLSPSRGTTSSCSAAPGRPSS